MDFKGKKIAITGASPDFGLTLSILFAQMGAELFISARTLEKANATANIVREQTPEAKVKTWSADMAKPEEVARFADGVKQATSHIDILINNASLWLGIPLQDATDEQIFETINSTATGSILLTKHLLPLLEKSSSPDIIFINSTASLEHHNSLIINEAFSAAKAAQSTFADRLRSRMKGSGLRVITIYPPHFENPSPLDESEWNKNRAYPEYFMLTAKNVFNGVKFALSQNRICSVDKIILSNNAPL